MDKKKTLTAAISPREGEVMQNLEFSQEDEFALEELRLEILLRQERALVEMKKILEESLKK